MKDKYFLFGKHACEAYDEEGIEGLIKVISGGEGYAIFHFIGGSTIPEELLSAYDGWEDFSVITKDEYDKLNLPIMET